MASNLSVKTNAFRIHQIPDYLYYQYQITFTSRKPLKRPQQNQYFHRLQNVVCPEIFRPRMIYDGASIAYCSSRLSFNGGPTGTFTISLASDKQVEEGRGITIIITPAAAEPIDLNHIKDILVNRQHTPRAQVAINLIQNIVRQWPNMHHTNNGRAYFPQNIPGATIGGGLLLKRGIFQSVRPSRLSSLVLQIDTCTAAVYRDGPLIDMCIDFLGIRNHDVRALELGESHANFRRLEKFVKKLKVIYTSPDNKRKTKVIHGLVPYAGRFGFMKDDREITVADHYKSAFAYTLRFPRIIGVRFSPKDAERPVVVPLEMCAVEPGQLYKKKIPENLISEVVRFATLSPNDKRTHIENAIQLYSSSEFTLENDIRIQTDALTVPAKRLISPEVKYQQKNAEIRGGAWNVMGQKFRDAKELQHWGCINYERGSLTPQIVKHRMTELLRCCENLGMRVNIDPAFVVDGNPQNPDAALRDPRIQKAFPKGPPQDLVIFIFLPDNAAPVKHAVKQWGDVSLGVITQCMRASKFQGQGTRPNNQYFNNVALKINARLGGVNSIVSSRVLNEALMGTSGQEVTIVMGADASHPGPGVQKPTTTSLVYSFDPTATRYMSFMGIQHPRTELIEDLEMFVYEAVKSVGRESRKSPTRIIFFRDGVSEGEYDKVRQVEVVAIDRAIDRLWKEMRLPDAKPKVTFIVVGKRHHAVFFPINQQPSNADRKGNCHPGTVVDEGITQPTEHEFYLQSHSAIQGTVRSAHYVVLRDDIFNFNLPKLEEVAFGLCHVYAKATRSVSIPAPVYYADIVCARGAIHIMDASSSLTFDDNATSMSGSEDTFDLTRWKAVFRERHERMRKLMFFL